VPHTDRMREDANVKEVIDVWSCPDLNEYQKDATQILYACERNLLSEIRRRLNDGKQLSAIVIDPTMPYTMGQVHVRIFKNL